MTINVFGGGSSGGPVFPLQRSVRLRSSNPAYFGRTFTTPTNNIIWTWSAWVKRGTFGTAQQLMGAGTSGTGADQAGISLQADNSFLFYQTQTGTGTFEIQVATTQVLRDPSAWYHIVVAYDSAQGTAANRVKIYINGVQVTAFTTATYPTSSLASRINAARSHDIGRYGSGVNYFDGYLTEVNFIDGQALTPASFGSINSTTGVWQPIKYSGTYGTNGFYLNFNDNSNNTATTIGKDNSGNSNNWTPNGISVTAGVTYDSMLDVPTLTSATNANFAVLNPLFNTSGTLSNANLTLAGASTTGQRVGTIAVSSGKWYYEVSCTSLAAGSDVLAGFSEINNTSASSQYPGQASTSYSIYTLSTNTFLQKVNNASSTNTNTAKAAQGDIIGVALDLDNGKIWFSKNNTFVDSGDPAAGTNAQYTSITGTYVPAFRASGSATSNSIDVNFGQRPFAGTVPTGFKSLNTYNLPAPTIPNGATQFAATTYTGTAAALTVTNTVNGKSFQPDFVWIKDRTSALNHRLLDSVRGVTSLLYSNLTDAQATIPNANDSFTSFNSNGFTLGVGQGMNASGDAYIGWQWKAGGTAVTNTSGSITSSVSANPSAGFSIVTYTGTGANATVGHGLGVAPKMMIFKNRDNAGSNWSTYHSAIGATNVLLLNGTGASVANGWLQNTSPTSTVFSLGAIADGYTQNVSTQKQVAYCFSEIAGYSKFGSYTGNGSTDGPFVYCGFRPRWILVKNSSVGTDSWQIWDSARNTFNVTQNYLLPNTSGAEGSGSGFFVDFTANGFKIRTTNTASNGNTNTLIYAAFAESPFNYSLAR